MGLIQILCSLSDYIITHHVCHKECYILHKKCCNFQCQKCHIWLVSRNKWPKKVNFNSIGTERTLTPLGRSISKLVIHIWATFDFCFRIMTMIVFYLFCSHNLEWIETLLELRSVDLFESLIWLEYNMVSVSFSFV